MMLPVRLLPEAKDEFDAAYIVLYREDQGEVIVISVFHTARDPSVWQARV